MTAPITRPDVESILGQLKDFQRDTVEYVFRRMYTDADATNRFLVADEVGLGKTHVARGLIAKAVDHLWDRVDRIDVIYICSNADIARQNIGRLNITGRDDFASASRMTLLPTLLHDIQRKRLNFISFTPGTSFQLKHAAGWAEERVLLYWLLQRAWNVRGVAPMNLLQGRVSDADRFRDWIDWYGSEKQIDETLSEAFGEALADHIERDRVAGRPDLRTRFDELCRAFSYKRKITNIPEQERLEQNRLIGDLRATLAATCVRALQPDIVVLDEFQRFKSLLGGEDDASLLAQELFNFEGKDGRARTLLLSATPYKMYTVTDEATDEDHYSDFLETLAFLQNDKAATARVHGILQSYRRALMRLTADGSSRMAELKGQLEIELRRVMARTERLAASADRNGMLSEVSNGAVTLEPRDVGSYRTLQEVARHVEHHDTMEFWKASPYLLNFMTEYKLKENVKAALANGQGHVLAECIAADQHFLLPRKVVDGRAPVNPPHPRLRWLLSDTIGKGLWQLLWLPPSLPYYELGTPFAKLASGVTKRLIFSAWRVVPRTIAALLSHEAERLMLRDLLEGRRSLEQARTRASQPLRFARSTDGRPVGMPVLALLYPSVALARLGDPLAIAGEMKQSDRLPPLAAVLAEARHRIEVALAPIIRRRSRPGGAADESWYWAAPVLLDLALTPTTARRWLDRPKLSAQWASEEHDPRTGDGHEHSAWKEHVAQLTDFAHRAGQLGPAPADLADVLALLAVAGPAVAALRALARVAGSDRAIEDVSVRDAAGTVAWGIRNLFNLPEVTGLIRQLNGEEPYWQRVLEYAAAGGLQAVLDEYAHILPESLGLITAAPEEIAKRVAGEMRQAIGVRAARVKADGFDIPKDGTATTLRAENLRARFAARFGEGDEDDGSDGLTAAKRGADTETRSAQLRRAFNSPFWPFVLATTAVGQEGLDFHHYCHAVVHWNLPSNPVDLEQREGRVHRYKGHAVRRNVARRLGPAVLASRPVDPWAWLFERARAGRPADASDVVPYWVYAVDGGATIERHVPALPLSRDLERLADLRRTLAVYRMVFGQPRQDELLDYLLRRMSRDEAVQHLDMLRIDLAPRAATAGIERIAIDRITPDAPVELSIQVEPAVDAVFPTIVYDAVSYTPSKLAQ
jgi:hypothetical protein